jgi:hypothetical protein
MPASSFWVLCLPRPDGSQDCQDIPALLSQPDIDIPDPAIKDIIDQIGRLQTIVVEVTEPELKMRVSQAIDGAVARVGPQLPAGYEFRRAARHDLGDDEFPGDPLPDVTGLFYVDGYNTLAGLGYAVTTKFQRVFAEKEDGLILSQEFSAGDVPPGKVTILVGVFLAPPDTTDQVPVIE